MKKLNQPPCETCESRAKSVFCDLKSTHLATMDHHKTCNTYKRGQVIFHEGNRPLGLYCIKQGKVKIYKTGPDGREQIVRLAKAGDVIGYRSFLGEEFYSASAASLDDASVCFLDRHDIHSIIMDEKTLAQNFIHLLSHELREAEDLIRDMAQKSVRERLAEILLILKDKFGTIENEPGLLDNNMTREELASFVGTATETLIRLLSDFKDDGLIETQGRKIRLLDIKRLAEVANIDF